MCKIKPSLFDTLISKIDYDIKQQFTFDERGSPSISGDSSFPEVGVVHYLSGRTGRETTMSVGRYCAITSLIPGLRKRFIGTTFEGVPVTSANRHDSAVLEFLEDNNRCANFDISSMYTGAFEALVTHEVMSDLARVLDGNEGSVINLQNISRSIMTGPGASSKTQSDPGYYGRLADGFLTASSKEVAHTYKICAYMTRLGYMTEAVRREIHGSHDVFDAHAIFLSVPKNNLINRGICTQPSANMALQLATHSVLSGVLKQHYGCDLATQQDLNKQLACWGSKGKKSFSKASWEFCTVDLSRASNFPWAMVCELLPSNVVNWLDHIRSRFMDISLTDQPVVTVKKEMCSTMGNGFTFSLMTVIFSSIVRTLYSLAGLPEYDTDPLTGESFKTWAVYGDDIIVDKSVYSALSQVLSAHGHLLNRKKSFSTGLFRESCGGDFYDGYPVRPVFLESLDTQADIFSLANRLVLWGVLHSVELPVSLSFLRGLVSKRDALRVPNWEDVAAGFHVPWSKANQKPVSVPKDTRGLLTENSVPYEVWVPKPKNRRLLKESVRYSTYSAVIYNNRHPLDDAFCGPTQGPYINMGIYPIEVCKEHSWNAENLPGALLGIIGGFIRKGQYGLRSNDLAIYTRTWKIAPQWGDPTLFRGTATRVSSDTSLSVMRLWEEYVVRNLYATVMGTNN